MGYSKHKNSVAHNLFLHNKHKNQHGLELDTHLKSSCSKTM
jgi:hypothetical protein